MAQRFTSSALAALALAATLGSLALPAAGENPKPGTIITVAGTGSPGFAGDNGPATQALLSGPFDLAFDAAGNLYIVDADNDRVRKVSAEETACRARLRPCAARYADCFGSEKAREMTTRQQGMPGSLPRVPLLFEP